MVWHSGERACRDAHTEDTNTYPVWWLCEFGRTGDLEQDKRNGSVIPLEAVLSGRGGPDMDREFNLYYVHWWSLTHYLLHSQEAPHSGRVAGILAGRKDSGGTADDIAVLERFWYGHTQAIKQATKGHASPPPILRVPHGQ